MAQFDLFQVSAMEDFESYEYVEYLEEGGGADEGQLANRINDLRIRMTDRDLITMPSDSYLQVRYRVAQANGDPFTTGNIAPVNGGWNVFKRAKYLLSNEIVEDILRPGYVRQVKGLIEYSDDFEKGQGFNEMWTPDRGSGGISDQYAIKVRNITQPTLLDYDLTLTAADPHVLQVAAGAAVGYADNDVLELYIETPERDIIIDVFRTAQAETTMIPVALDARGALGAAIDFAGATANDGVHFFAEGIRIKIVGTDLVDGNFLVDATPAIVFSNGNAVVSAATSTSDLFPSNTGFIDRQKRCLSVGSKTDKSISLYMPLRRLFPFLKENMRAMKGIEQELVFDLNDFHCALLRDADVDGNADGEIILQRLSWWVPVVRPSLVVKNTLNSALNSGITMDLPWTANNHYYSQPRNNQDSSWLINTTEHRPTGVYVFFQLDSKFRDQTQNNMLFDTMDLERIFIRINSDRQYPNREFRINYGESSPRDEDYSRVYHTYLNACKVAHSDDCVPAVSYDEFKTLYPLYYFDLRAQDEQVWESSTQAHITVEYILRTAPVADYRIHAILDTKRMIQIQGVNGRMTRVQ